MNDNTNATIHTAMRQVVDITPDAPEFPTITHRPRPSHNGMAAFAAFAGVIVVLGVVASLVSFGSTSDSPVAGPDEADVGPTYALAEPEKPLPDGVDPRVTLVPGFGGQICVLAQTPYSGSNECLLPSNMSIPNTLHVSPSVLVELPDNDPSQRIVKAIEIFGAVTQSADQLTLQLSDGSSTDLDLSRPPVEGFRGFITVLELPTITPEAILVYKNDELIATFDVGAIIEDSTKREWISILAPDQDRIEP